MERAAFDAAVARHQRKVHTLARYLLSDLEEAEDVTQEVLIRLWRHGAEVAAERVQSWLLRVTRNACYDRLRRRRSASRLFVSDTDHGAVATAMVEAPDPETLAEASEFGRRLCGALARLREPAKSIVILREIQGLSYQQIADTLELPLSTVRVSLHRARRRLREHLREVYDHVAAN
jgi:RNA polymerase sigma factor (sigma-70 family)